MPRSRLLLFWPGMFGLVLYGTLVVCQWREAAALSEFRELERANPLNSVQPAGVGVLERKMAALLRAARMDHFDPEPLYQQALLDLGTAEAESLSSVESERDLGAGPDTKLLGRLRAAARAIRAAIVRNPGIAEYHFVAALVFQNLIGDGIGGAPVAGSEQVVTAHLDNSGQLDPYKPSLHFKIGSFQMALGDHVGAKRSFDVAFADN